MTSAEKYQAAVEKIELARAEAASVAKEAFSEMCAEVFEQHPSLDAFRWKQYTPYFNDGDPCTFRCCIDASDIDVCAVGSDEFEEGYEVSSKTDYDEKARKSFPKKELHPLYNAQEAASELLGKINEEQLKELFGDHAEITAYRDGDVEVEEYEHD